LHSRCCSRQKGSAWMSVMRGCLLLVRAGSMIYLYSYVHASRLFIWMHVCMYVCIHIKNEQAHTLTRIQTHARTNARTHTNIQTQTRVNQPIHALIQTHPVTDKLHARTQITHTNTQTGAETFSTHLPPTLLQPSPPHTHAHTQTHISSPN